MCWLRGPSSRGRNASTRGTMIPLNWKLRLPPGHFGFFMPVNEQGGYCNCWGNCSHHEGTGLLLHNGGKEKYAWNTEDLLTCFLIFTSYDSYQQKTTKKQFRQDCNGPDPSRIRVWSHLRWLLRAKNMEWIEGGCYKCQLQFHDQLKTALVTSLLLMWMFV